MVSPVERTPSDRSSMPRFIGGIGIVEPAGKRCPSVRNVPGLVPK